MPVPQLNWHIPKSKLKRKLHYRLKQVHSRLGWWLDLFPCIIDWNNDGCIENSLMYNWLKPTSFKIFDRTIIPSDSLCFPVFTQKKCFKTPGLIDETISWISSYSMEIPQTFTELACPASAPDLICVCWCDRGNRHLAPGSRVKTCLLQPRKLFSLDYLFGDLKAIGIILI